MLRRSTLAVLTLLVLLAFIGTPSARAQEFEQKGDAPPDGATIFRQNCAKCHGPTGQGVNAMLTIAGPPLTAVHDRQKAVAMVLHGKGVMPSFEPLLSFEQIQAVADYVTQRLAVIPLNEGNLSEGGELFRQNCAACHRTAARGGAMAFTGINAPSLAPLDASTIAGAIRWGPGPMPAFSSAVLNDKQLDSIVDYVLFVQHPPRPGGAALNWYGPVAEGLIAWIAILAIVLGAGWIERRTHG